MPKVYDDVFKGRSGREQDPSVSGRMARRAELESLGFAAGAAALSPRARKDGFEMRVASGSFAAEVEHMWWIRKQANAIATGMGKAPDPEVVKRKGGSTRPASKAWAAEVRGSGQLRANEDTFARMLRELQGKLHTTFETLAYNKQIDMLAMKSMDRHTLAMYITRAEADIEEVTTIYSQLVALMPQVEGAQDAHQVLTEVGADVARLRGELVLLHRTFRQESMVVRAGPAPAGTEMFADPQDS
ncbi:MAG: hypothetical protein ACI9WU_005394 [Myxococcota bacterium]|jgi:hypothetical protein